MLFVEGVVCRGCCLYGELLVVVVVCRGCCLYRCCLYGVLLVAVAVCRVFFPCGDCLSWGVVHIGDCKDFKLFL